MGGRWPSASSNLIEFSDMDETDWANLAPELLALVVQRVCDGAGEKGEGRRIVALAGVCSNWRNAVQQQCCPHSSLLLFPCAIRQPGPSHTHVQCLLKKKGNTYRLFQTVGPDHEEYFVLAARKQFGLPQSCFKISSNPRSFKRHIYMATLNTNFLRSKFSLRDSCLSETQESAPTLSLEWHEVIVDGTCQRKLCCNLQPSRRKFSTREDGELGQCPSRRMSTSAGRILRKWSWLPIFNRQLRQSSISVKEIGGRFCAEAELEKTLNVGKLGTARVNRDSSAFGNLSLTSKAPAWNEEQLCWSLDFKGRATMASIHNFQLVSVTNGFLGARSESIVLQLGKIGNGLFILDFCAPLSSLEAFSICLSSFATGAGLQP